MTREFEPLLSPQPIEVPYVLPDGLKCNWIYVPNNMEIDQLYTFTEEKLREASPSTKKTDLEIRISANSSEKIEKLGSYLKERYKDCEISWGQTTFFESPIPFPESLLSNFRLDWNIYKNGYYLYRATHNMEREKVVAKTLMFASFATNKEKGYYKSIDPKVDKIDRVFDEAFRHPQNHLYMVKRKDDDKFVGCFVVKYVPSLGEVQLHSVAGRHLGDPRISGQPRKQPILMAGLLEVIKTEYPTEISYGYGNNRYKASGIEKLTFSSSGAAHLYESLGFEKSSRDGLVIKV